MDYLVLGILCNFFFLFNIIGNVFSVLLFIVILIKGEGVFEVIEKLCIVIK